MQSLRTARLQDQLGSLSEGKESVADIYTWSLVYNHYKGSNYIVFQKDWNLVKSYTK